MSTLMNNQENATSKVKYREQELSEIKQEFLIEKTWLNEKIDELREKLGYSNDELVKS